MEVKLPQLAEGVEAGTVVSILVSEGQEIRKDQPFMELETQKAVGSIPSPQSGTVTKIHVREGMEVAVGQVLITLETTTGATTTSDPTPKPNERVATVALPPSSQSLVAPSPGAGEPDAQRSVDSYRYESKSSVPPPAAPSIRKIARELGIDLTRVKGSEAGGRIVLQDVRVYIEGLQRVAFQEKPPPGTVWEAPSRTPAAQPSETVNFAQWGPVRREKMAPLRRTVSQRMLQSWTTIPKINQFHDADITRLLALRKKYASIYQKKGAHLTLTTFILKVVAGALQKHPRVNASIDESANEIVFKNYYHVGVAVDTDAGLIVPTLRDVDKKSLVDLSHELKQLTEKTRQRKLSIEELQGGSFTISNQGSIGGSYFTPIIYAPQVAILGVGQGGPKPVVVGAKVTVRTLLPLCLSYDHRVLDGADAVRFLQEIVAGLESFPEAEVKIK